MTEDVEISTFSWRQALLGPYDILHIHWPEAFTRHPSRPGRLAKRLLTRVLILRTRFCEVPVVRTAHNLTPHEDGGRTENRLLRRIDAATAFWIRLNPVTELPSGARGTTILHGHYRGRFQVPGSGPIRGRILQFGLIRPYKGIERLLTVFAGIRDNELGLRIVGRPGGGTLEETICAAAVTDGRITHELRFVEDEELAAEVTAAEIVVLPYLHMHNSGALLVALSLNRPVLVPRTPTNEAIAEEVGPGWLTMFDGALDAPARSFAERAPVSAGCAAPSGGQRLG